MKRRARRWIAVFGLGLFFSVVLIASVTQSIVAAPGLALPDERAIHILVEKSARQLSLLRDDAILKTYRIGLGSDPVGPKSREGDNRAPEGIYAIDFKNDASRFHLSLRDSYPDANDRAGATAAGVSPGGDIMIHGLPNGLGWLGAALGAYDWTDGCIAVTNAEIEEIWSLVETGTSIEIRP
jgi:murein L,D-transpeptidase YafK